MRAWIDECLDAWLGGIARQCTLQQRTSVEIVGVPSQSRKCKVAESEWILDQEDIFLSEPAPSRLRPNSSSVDEMQLQIEAVLFSQNGFESLFFS